MKSGVPGQEPRAADLPGTRWPRATPKGHWPRSHTGLLLPDQAPRGPKGQGGPSAAGFSGPGRVLDRAELTEEEAEDPQRRGISWSVEQADHPGPAGQVGALKAQEAPGPAGGSRDRGLSSLGLPRPLRGHGRRRRLGFCRTRGKRGQMSPGEGEEPPWAPGLHGGGAQPLRLCGPEGGEGMVPYQPAGGWGPPRYQLHPGARRVSRAKESSPVRDPKPRRTRRSPGRVWSPD